jgi:Zinc finger, C2H2 type
MRNVHIYPASKCEVCGKMYKRKDKLKKHMLVHSRKMEEEDQEQEQSDGAAKSAEKKNVFCQYCGKVYAK